MPDPLALKLLTHYDAHARALPWRVPPGGALPDAYSVWLSEIMLQQTTVAAVTPYFERFIAKWPTVAALAAAEDNIVMAAWAGLGYYARARNLLACARLVVAEHKGAFPADETALRTLPGIGLYTAAAIAAIAYGQRAVVVDGNVERVMARVHAVTIAPLALKRELYALAALHTPDARCGDYAQALMDLGATICTPRSPRCLLCPIASDCAGRTDPLAYPVRVTKATRPERVDSAYWLIVNDHVLLIRRPAQGLLGGMRALPVGEPPVTGGWQEAGIVRHIFTHFALTLSVRVLELKTRPVLDGEWWPIADIANAGMPSLFRKAATRALATSESNS